MQLYFLFDKSSKTQGEVMFFDNDDSAVRACISMLVNEAKHNVLFNVSDFELHKIEGIELNVGENKLHIVNVVTCSGVKDGEDLFFRSQFVHDFSTIDVEFIRKQYETERLTEIENQLQKIERALERRS